MMETRFKGLYLRNIYFAVFFLSGFSGLIYESIWTQYLKLFLGHAAYAQALVLFIFMGGMSAGAWQAARYGNRIRNLLVIYAAVEGIIGLCSFAFHQVFLTATDFVFLGIMPSVDGIWTADLFRWTLAALLVLPQSFLLGTTFPLMSAGIIRTFPKSPGKTLSVLYFTNTIGAAIGVLISGFILIDSIGLQGTLFVAGTINLSLAIVVWMLSHDAPQQTLAVTFKPEIIPATAGARNLFAALLICSAVTGTASFMYEIAWIRMLSFVLGSSTHAFELMLSAFLLGLAIGSFWVRRRVDSFKNPLLVLGWIQLLMGIMALATLPIYGQSFEFMAHILKSISRTDQGYLLFNISSHVIALAVMLPATICAGMTLPIITYILLAGGHGEPAIGKVYSTNTLGGMVGIAASVLFVMPVLGLKALIIVGVILDIVLGLSILWYVLPANKRRLWLGSAVVSCGILSVVIFSFHLNPDEIASAVFRTGEIREKDEILFHEDGKTATVILARSGDKLILSTNGKPDASISTSEKSASDELTQILSAAIPMAVHPAAKKIAAIGMGSGLTSSIVLANPDIQRLDTIEIEAAMVRGAKGYGKRVSRTFNDPRSHIIIEDAKAFFPARKIKYDIIISEPSNPWVSGVAGLYSQEFYHLVKRYIESDGLFVQWMHLYEIDIELISSIIKAISREFDDYNIYFTGNSDILILARNEGKIPEPSDSIFELPELKDELTRIGIYDLTDLVLRYLGNKKTLDGLFATYPTPPNSDYFPSLDQGAVKARFLKKNAKELLNIRTVALPVLEVLEGREFVGNKNLTGVKGHSFIRLNYQKAITIVNHFKQDNKTRHLFEYDEMEDDLVRNLRSLKTIENQCSEAGITAGWLPGLHWLARSVFPYVQSNELKPFWRYLESARCYPQMPAHVHDWIRFYMAVDQRDYSSMIRLSDKMLSSGLASFKPFTNYLVASALLGSIALGNSEYGTSVLFDHMHEITHSNPLMRLLKVHILDMRKNKRS